MALTTQQQMLIEQRLNNDKKSTVVAYLLWFFLAGFGAHRFYLGRTGSGIAQLLLMIGGFVLLVVYVGLFLLLALGIWVLVDAFLIPGMVESDTRQQRERLTQNLISMAGAA